MSLEVAVCCDNCGALMTAAKTGAEARRAAREDLGAVTALPGGKDLCKECAGR